MIFVICYTAQPYEESTSKLLSIRKNGDDSAKISVIRKGMASAERFSST
jgi:hypothetical protein